MSRARRTTTAARRAATVVVGVLVALPLALVTLLAAAVPAEASTYRYWTYWWGSGTGKAAAGWTFAQVGPAGHRVGDAWVLGWRFATTSTVGGTPPRQSADFATLCPGLSTTASGSVRVALVVDYGTTADAPPGQTPPTTSTVRRECLSVPAGSSGADVLRQASVPVRSENGLLCALDGYPVGECAPVVADPAPSPTRTTSPTTPASARSTRPAVSPASPTRTPGAATPATTSAAALVAPRTPTASMSPTAPASTAEPTLPAAAGEPAGSASPAGSPAGLVVGAAVVAGIAGSAWWTARRRGRTP
jgi:hypothetical protein